MMLPPNYPPNMVLKALLGGIYDSKVAHHILGSLWMFLLLRAWDVGVMGALVGAFGFSLCTGIVSFTAADHGGKLYTTSLLPLMLLIANTLTRKGSFLAVGFGGLVVGFLLRAKHPQIAYYGLLAFGLLLVFRLPHVFREERYVGTAKTIGKVLVVLLVGYFLAASLLLPAQEYAPHSIRGAGPREGLDYDYATQWSFHPAEAITLVIPGFLGFGGASYWGHMPFTDAPNYAGILVVALALLAAVVRFSDSRVRFLLAMIVLSLLVSMGKYFPLLYDPFFKYLPQFNKFRVPVLILVLLQVGLCVLAGMGVDALLKGGQRFLKRVGWCGIGLGALLLILSTIVGDMARDAHRPGEERYPASTMAALTAQRASLAASDTRRSGGFVLLGGVLILVVALGGGSERKVSAAITLLAVVSVIDMWGVSARVVKPKYSEAQVARELRPTPAENWLSRQQGLFRVFPVDERARSNRFMAFDVSSVMGYFPAKISHYSTLLEAGGARSLPVLRMLNTKFILSTQPVQAPFLEEVKTFGSESIYRLEGALPRAWFVSHWRILPAEEQLPSVIDPTFRPDSLALIEQDPGIIPGGAGRIVSITRPNAEQMEMKVEVDQDALLVISEVFYEPGWKILIDGSPSPSLRVNYVLMGVPVEQGIHEVTLVYDSRAERLGSTLALLGWAGVIVLVGMGIVTRGRIHMTRMSRENR